MEMVRSEHASLCSCYLSLWNLHCECALHCRGYYNNNRISEMEVRSTDWHYDRDRASHNSEDIRSFASRWDFNKNGLNPSDCTKNSWVLREGHSFPEKWRTNTCLSMKTVDSMFLVICCWTTAQWACLPCWTMPALYHLESGQLWNWKKQYADDKPEPKPSREADKEILWSL